MARNSLEISLLGRFEVRVSGSRSVGHDIPGRKAPALLKLLALNRDHQLVRDQVIELLWPDLDGAGAAAQLYKAIHQLRKALAAGEPQVDAGDCIATSRNLVLLTPPGGVITDVQAFERAAHDAIACGGIRELERAVALYSGDLLPMDSYAAWARGPRDQLRQLHVDVLLALARGQRVRRDFVAAAETYRMALEQDGTLEIAHRGLMTIYASQGQRDRALKQYGICLDALADELGVAPSRETRELYDEIERQAPDVAAVSDRTRLLATSPMVPPVNREAECRFIAGCLDLLRTGRGSVLVIEGPAGIGKTRLIQELTVRAQRRGVRVLVGSAYEMEGAVAYGPFLEILQAALRDSPEGQEQIPAEIASALSGQRWDARPLPSADPRAARTYLFAGIGEFLRQRTSSTPLVVALENVHAADQGSIELFHFLARRLQDVPLLLVATRRKEEVATGDRWDKLIRSLREAVTVNVLALAPLDPVDHHELLRQHGGGLSISREQSDEIFRLSEGNPLYALELNGFRGLPELPGVRRSPASATIPPSLRDSVAERLVKLSPPARELLTLVAVAGEGVPYPLLETLWPGGDAGAEHAGTGLLDLLDQLIAARLLQERGIQYHFRHALHRSCVYESISEARRRVVHARVAHGLVSLGERGAEPAIEQIAFHYQRAGDARQAAHFLMLAGQRAASMYAHDDALRHYHDALRLLEPAKSAMVKRICGNLHSLIGDTSRAAGYLNESLAAYESAFSSIEGLPVDKVQWTELHRKVGLLAIFVADMPKAGRHLAQAWHHAGHDPRVHAQLHILRALYLWHCNRLEEAAEYAHRALDLAEAAQAEVESAQACEILAMACLPLGRWQEGLLYERRRLRHGRWSPDLVVATDAHLCLWEYHVHDDRMLDQASAFMRDVATEADRLGDLRCVAICRYALGTIHLWRGDRGTALQHLDESLALHDRVGSPAGMAYVLARRAVLHTLAGALDRGWESVRKGIEEAQRASIRDHCLQRLYGVGLWNRLKARDTEQVLDLVARSEALLDANGPCTACSVELYPWLAFHYLECGDPDRAANCADRLEQLVAETGNPVGEVAAAIVRAGAERARGDDDRYRYMRQQALDRMQGAVWRGAASPMSDLFERLAAPR